jgi:hypothetical protein
MQEGDTPELSFALAFLRSSLDISNVRTLFAPFNIATSGLVSSFCSDIRMTLQHLRDFIAGQVGPEECTALLKFAMRNGVEIERLIKDKDRTDNCILNSEVFERSFHGRPVRFWNVGADLETHGIIDPFLVDLRGAMNSAVHEGRAFVVILKQIEVQFRHYVPTNLSGKLVVDEFFSI